MFKKYIKVVISILTLCIVLFNNTYTCYAVSSNVTVESWMQQLGDAIRTFTITLEIGEHLTGNALRDYVKKSFDSVGLLIDESGILLDKIKTAIHGVDNNFDDQTADEDDIGQWIVDNTEVVNGDVVFGDKYNSFIKEYNENYVEEFEYYQGYTLDLSGWDFSGNPTFVNLIKDNQDDNYLLWFNNITGYNGWRLLCIPKIEANDSIRFFYTGNVNNNDDVKLCKITNALNLTTDPRNLFQNCTVYNGNGTIITSGDNFSTQSVYFALKTGLKSTDFSLTGSQFWLVSYDKSYSIIVHKTVEGLENSDEGIAPYYYNNSVWSNFVNNSSGDYTVTTSNVNTVTYGDTVSYINDYHDTNNNYPDNSTVNTWIETTNNNNNSGGGSGDDSGGGSGGGSGDDSGGGSGIVSILTALGKAIADLITGIAAFLAEVVGGLVEAITGLLDTLTELITNFTESIPNIFSPLLGWLFDGLPEEFTAIILLGLTACVIASIIKILRG